MEGIHTLSQVFLELYRASSTSKEEIIQDYIQKVLTTPVEEISEQVPDFIVDSEWMNTTQPLSIYSDLEGKLIILEFFTYCCINCIHIQTNLKKLENQFSVEDGLVIIGVHAAKFSNEKITANINNAVRRYNITHPVVNDSQGFMWRSLCIMCWPTLFIIGPHGKPLLLLQGEGYGELLRLFVKNALIIMKDAGDLSNNPLPQIKVTENLISYGQLLYPGKIASVNIDDGCSLIAVSDTGHNRILITMENGTVKHVIGGLKKGLKNGNFKEARFHAPQGLVFKNHRYLYVADTENHAIREIDLEEKCVQTIAGNGTQGYNFAGGEYWTDQQISSPWDLCFAKDYNILFIAMAGIHQIWALFLDDDVLWNSKEYNKGVCIAIAGTGQEENRNNCYPRSASFAQPSGLSYCPDSHSFFIADSESSTVRCLFLDDGKVSAVVGGSKDPKNLFQYGDKDGIGYDVKLQHPLAVAWHEDRKKLYVADSYNHKIKEINLLDDYHCITILMDTKLDEPGGLCAQKNNLLIADTNNHRIKSFKFSDNSVSVLHITIPKNLRPEEITDETDIMLHNSGGEIRVSIKLTPPNDEISESLTGCWMVDFPDESWKLLNKPNEDFQLNVEYVIAVPENKPGTCSQLYFKGQIYLCVDGKCFSENMMFVVTLQFSVDATRQASCNFNYKLA